ncbi:MAG: hypothetical protein PHW04_11650 [Candidatus Wallbacteria bacterium]|nr:hypothetical protein [Candidatus Wallbacteria bacterium]
MEMKKMAALCFLLLTCCCFAAQPVDPGEIGDVIFRDGAAGSFGPIDYFTSVYPVSSQGIGHNGIFTGYYKEARECNEREEGTIAESMDGRGFRAVGFSTLKSFKNTPPLLGGFQSCDFRGAKGREGLTFDVRKVISTYVRTKAINKPTYYSVLRDFSYWYLAPPVHFYNAFENDENGNPIGRYQDDGTDDWELPFGDGSYRYDLVEVTEERIDKLGNPYPYTRWALRYVEEYDTAGKCLNVFPALGLFRWHISKQGNYLMLIQALYGVSCILSSIGVKVGW